MADIGGKSAVILCILKVLEQYSSEDRPLSNSEVIGYLQDEYNISITPNTLRANISILRDGLEYPVSTFEENGKGLYLATEQIFDDEEVRVLIDSVLTSRYIPEHQANALIKKLTGFANKAFAKKLTHIHPLNEWNHQRNKSFFWNLSCLSESIAEKKQAEFYYNNVLPDGTLEHKSKQLARVHPYAIVCSNGQYYLICSLGNYDNLLHYRIDRMTEVKKREKAARSVTTVPGCEKGLNIAAYASEHHFMYGGKAVPVTLKMPSDRAGDVMDNFGSRARMRDLGDGTMEVYLTAVPEGIRYFALQFGTSGCEVISPQSLRDAVKDDIRVLVKKYGV